MPPIMANSKKDKYLNTRRKILSQEMRMCNMYALELTEKKLLARFFLNWSNAKVKRLSTYKKISSQEIFMWNIKALALTIQKF